MKFFKTFFLYMLSTVNSQICEISLPKTCSDGCPEIACEPDYCLVRRDNCCDIECILDISPTVDCPDTDQNGIVDVSDILAMLARFNIDSDYYDLNDNGYVDVSDILITLGSFGSECSIEDSDSDTNTNPDIDTSCNPGDECGGQIFTECGTSCPLVCGNPPPMMCNRMCFIGYQCDQGGELPWYDNNLHRCVAESECSEQISLPPGVSIGRPFTFKKEILLAELVEGIW